MALIPTIGNPVGRIPAFGFPLGKVFFVPAFRRTYERSGYQPK
jgi:hypothetical protein